MKIFLLADSTSTRACIAQDSLCGYNTLDLQGRQCPTQGFSFGSLIRGWYLPLLGFGYRRPPRSNGRCG
jgi:hypothetical protein